MNDLNCTSESCLLPIFCAISFIMQTPTNRHNSALVTSYVATYTIYFNVFRLVIVLSIYYLWNQESTLGPLIASYVMHFNLLTDDAKHSM